MNNFLESWPSGIIKTKPRESIISVLQNAAEPLTSLQIFEEIKKSYTSISLSTIYRSLEQFVEKGVVSKLTILNRELAVYEMNRNQHRHYAVCLGCHKILPMDYCPLEKTMAKAIANDFEVTGHNIEIFGYCSDCKAL